MKSLLLVCLLFVSGCAATLENTPDRPSPYAGDMLLFRADSTIKTSYDTMHSFVTWEKNFRPIINDLAVKHSADNVRTNGERWVASAINCRTAYKANPKDALAQDELTAILKVINQALAEALSYQLKYTKQN